jgi:hypothetical protein
VNAQDAAVAEAALGALIRSGTAEDVRALVALAIDAPKLQVRQAAFETVRRMPASGVDGALSDWFAQNADPPAVMVRLALARRSPELVPALLKAAHRLARPRAWRLGEPWRSWRTPNTPRRWSGCCARRRRARSARRPIGRLVDLPADR